MATRETVEIGGTVFHIHKFDVFAALKIAGDLQKQFIGPLLGVLDGKEAGSPEAVTAGIMQGVERVSRDLDGDKLVALARRLVLSENVIAVPAGAEPTKLSEQTWRSILFDVGDLLELCLAVVRFNFTGLFTKAAPLIGAARGQSPTPASSLSSGGSLPN
jgi:hypothetical protein